MLTGHMGISSHGKLTRNDVLLFFHVRVGFGYGDLFFVLGFLIWTLDIRIFAEDVRYGVAVMLHLVASSPTITKSLFRSE